MALGSFPTNPKFDSNSSLGTGTFMPSVATGSDFDSGLGLFRDSRVESLLDFFPPDVEAKKRSWSVHSGPKYKRCYILWWRSMSSSWSLGFSTDSKTHGICDFGCGGDGNGKDLNVISYHGRVRLKIFLLRITNCSVYIGNLFGFLEAYPSMIIQVFPHSSNSSNGDGDGDGDDVGWESTVVLTGDVSLNLWSRALLASSLDGSNLGD